MLFNLLSPVAVLFGIVLAAVTVIFLWPVGEYGVPIALMAFAVGAGLTEIIRRLTHSGAAKPEPIEPGKN